MPDQPIPATDSATPRPKPARNRQMPEQRWQIFPAQNSQAELIAEATALSPLLAQVLINRGIYTPEQAWEFLDPETPQLPSPLDEFPDLDASLALLESAIAAQQKILICGDYDADGMTSTALLMRSLRHLGARVNYAIPSRMSEGYGINQRIVQDFHDEGGSLILTVDNGIAAYEPIALARDLGLDVIITDHHEIPEQLPPANAILNPKLIRETSPYRGVAGVGVAYILAVCLAQRFDQTQDLTAPLLALFTLGTIADLAPLTGVNRRWVKRGLKLLPKSRIPGIQALIEVAGLSEESNLRPEAIGFRLGPRINAVGRIADPQIVIDLLTTDDIGVALQRAMQCEEANQLRRQMCEVIETQAVEWCEAEIKGGQLDLNQARVLVVVQPEWHHGVIGIVASRLVERYGVPVFIGTYEDKGKKEIRGSARSIPEFNVFEALQFCDDLLDSYGGHRAAGGFSFKSTKLRQVKSRLSNFACQHLQPEHLKPLVTADVQMQLADITHELYTQIDQLHPCGIENPDPVFWTASIAVVDQKVIGKGGDHLKLTVTNGNTDDPKVALKAIAWRWGTYYPLPRELDIAYKLRLNEWQGRRTVELELVGVRAATPVQESGIEPWPASKSASNRRQNAEPLPAGSAPQATESNLSPTISTPTGKKSLAQASLAQPTTNRPAIRTTREVARALQAEINNNPITANRSQQPATKPDSPSQVAPLPANKITSPPANESYTDSSAIGTAELVAESGLDIAPLNFAESAAIASPVPLLNAANALHVEFYHSKRRYKGTLAREGGDRQLTIENADGHLLVVQLSARQGFLYLPKAAPQTIDITDLRYFNLIRAGLNAIEVKQKTQLIIRKDELLSEKDRQIDTLKAQISLLEEKVTQLSAERQRQFAALKSEMQAQESTIQDQEAHIEQLHIQVSSAPPSAATLKQQVQAAISSDVWFCLQPASQKDLLSAYKSDQLINKNGPDAHIADYSEAGLRLSFTVEREVLTPFFADLNSFLRQSGATEVGGITFSPGRKYTLGMMPSLLADQWRSFKSGELSLRALPESGVTIVQVRSRGQVSGRDRDLVSQFLNQWEHPMATCFSQKGRQAASSLDQISKLRNIAAHGESFLYRWQYDLLHQLIAGKDSKGGLLRQIFGLA